MSIYFSGLIIGAFCFLVIGLFHPIVIKTEYYTGTRFWWVFLVIGMIGCIAALFIKNILISAVASVVAFTCFWSIKELFEQRERVRNGWFPRNPARNYEDEFGVNNKK
ncbi:MAG: DUF4491 family protein [Bacteroidaceae bacterium]|jgi:hypothetical protein|nr:DUF4491 family protein [Bacteroidaceae bacterium]